MKTGTRGDARHHGGGPAPPPEVGLRAGSADPTTTTGRLTANGGGGSSSSLHEPVSPELVLVDPALRELIFRSEPDPIPAHRDGSASFPGLMLRPAVAGSRAPLQGEPLGSAPSPKPSRRVVLAAAAVGGSVATFALGLALAGVHFAGTNAPTQATESVAGKTDSGPQTHARVAPTAAKTDVSKTSGGGAPARRVVATPPRRTKTATAQKPPAPARRFAWPPAPGATSYEVAVYKNDVAVFRARTPHTSIVIPGRLEHSGSHRLLGPGSYNWYVWPVRNGRTDSVALVRSTFVVPRG